MKKFFFITHFAFCLAAVVIPHSTNAQIVDSSVTQKDSLQIMKEDLMNAESNDNYLVDESGMLENNFQLRVINAIYTQKSFYNIDLFRVDAETRVTSDFLTVQGWYKITRRINTGFFLTGKSLKVGSPFSSVLNGLRFENTNSSKVALRYIAPVFKIILYQKKIRLVYQNIFYIPLSESYELRYKDKIVLDNNYLQWFHELLYNNVYSNYFTLNMGLSINYRFENVSIQKKITVKGSVAPYFNYYVFSAFKFYCFLDLNPTLSNGIFSSFSLREGAGLHYKFNSHTTFDLLYTYIALGKSTLAVNALVTGIKYNF